MCCRLPSRSVPGLALSLAVATPSAWAEDLLVPQEYPTIQAAIFAANTLDRVLVSPGVYFEHIDFLGKPIEVASAEGAAVTVLDGAGSGPVVTFQSEEGPSSVLRGFTIQNAVLADPSSFGAAIRLDHTTHIGPWILENVFQDNRAHQGAAIGSSFGDAIIKGNVFHSNTAAFGSALWIQNARPTFYDNVVTDNVGSALYLKYCQSFSIAGNVIRGNRTEGDGGGIAVAGTGNGEIRDNLIENNEAARGGSMELNGGMWVAIYNNRILGNRAEFGGGISQGGSGDTVIWRNVIRDNEAYGDTERYELILSGTTPLETSWTIPEFWYPGIVWAMQAIVREGRPTAGNTSNPWITKIE